MIPSTSLLAILVPFGIAVIALVLGRRLRDRLSALAALIIGGVIVVAGVVFWLEHLPNGIHPETSWPWVAGAWLVVAFLVGRRHFERTVKRSIDAPSGSSVSQAASGLHKLGLPAYSFPIAAATAKM